MEYEIRKAVQEEANLLTGLTLASKRYWGYRKTSWRNGVTN